MKNTVETPFAKAALCRKVLAGLAGIFALAASARAALTITLQQVGSDVVATSSGSLELSGLGLVTSSGSTSLDYINAANGSLFVGTPGSSSVYNGFTTSGSLGTGDFTVASSYSGDLTGPDEVDNYLFLPHNYVSGSDLVGTATWANTDFTALGLTEGASLTYTWSGDSITVNVQSAIPEPATAVLLSGCAALVWGALRRRRANNYRRGL